MNATIITIGDEILIGQVIDSNSAFIASELNSIGIWVRMIYSVGDLEDDIINTLDNSIQNSDLVILTGGLGPTNDDITREVLAKYFNSKLVIHKESLDNINKILSSRDVKLSERNINQAEIPENCEVLKNRHGSAPGMIFRKNGKIIVSLPGVPYEMKAIVSEELIPLLLNDFTLPSLLHKTVLTVGIAESTMADTLEFLEMNLPSNMKLAYLPGTGLLRLRLSIAEYDKKSAQKQLDAKLKELVKIIGENHIFGFDHDLLPSVIGKQLIKKDVSLSIAESCTGGNIAHLITSVPGASEYFMGSVTAYSNEVKINILGVKEEDINYYGAVSKEVVEQMAKGIKVKFNTDYSIATSGIAGPDGGTPDKPVGTTWIAVATPRSIISKKFLLGEHRERNIIKASLYALNMLRNELI